MKDKTGDGCIANSDIKFYRIRMQSARFVRTIESFYRIDFNKKFYNTDFIYCVRSIIEYSKSLNME